MLCPATAYTARSHKLTVHNLNGGGCVFPAAERHKAIALGSTRVVIPHYACIPVCKPQYEEGMQARLPYVRAVGTAGSKRVEKHAVVDVVGKVSHKYLHVPRCVLLLAAECPVES